MCNDEKIRFSQSIAWNVSRLVVPQPKRRARVDGPEDDWHFTLHKVACSENDPIFDILNSTIHLWYNFDLAWYISDPTIYFHGISRRHV